MKITDQLRRRARDIVRLLKKQYPDAKCALHYENPLQLLVATVLSAQCTDVRVNMVTPALFQRYPDAEAFANADTGELETAIKSTGFFRMKSRSIQESARRIVAEHGGKVPNTLEELVHLPGVGRRVSHRLGLTKQTDPEKIEHDLMEVIPRKEWTMFSHRMIFHGRQICVARKPKCEICVLNKVCPKIGVKK